MTLVIQYSVRLDYNNHGDALTKGESQMWLTNLERMLIDRRPHTHFCTFVFASAVNIKDINFVHRNSCFCLQIVNTS